MKKLLREWRKWLGDALLVLGILLCFGTFALRLGHSPQSGGWSDSVGTLIEGTAARKAAGSTAYVPIAPGTVLHNMDTLWIDANQSAVILWMNSETIAFSEKTLTVLKKPFSSSIALKNQIIVLRGKGKVKDKATELVPAQPLLDSLPAIPPAPKPSVTPSPSPSPASPPQPKASPSNAPSPHPTPAAEVDRILPKPGATMYSLLPSSTDVNFYWTELLSGYFMIRDESNQGVDFFPLARQNRLRLPRKQNRAYAWQITDSKKKTVLGPFRFELKVGTLKNLEKLLNDAEKKPGEIRLDQ